MMQTSKYRWVGTCITGAFLLFNVGLPIVIASCPMSVTPAPACGMCSDDSASQRLTNTKNTSCCATVIAADKNSTEFVRIQHNFSDNLAVVAKAFSSADPCAHTPGVAVVFHDISPPVFTDIPIFTSSLLI